MKIFQRLVDSSYFENIEKYFDWIQSDPWHYVALIIDLILVFYLVKKTYDIVKDTNTVQLLKGIVILVLITFVSGWCGLYVLNYILKSIMTYGVLLFMIVFQPEIRRALGNIGNNKKLGKFFKNNKESENNNQLITNVVEACEYMSSKHIGALIVISRDVKLNDYMQTGINLHADVSKELLINIFEPNTPLHDGAVIIEDNIIKVASCILPLTKRTDLKAEFGTRHRACIGISEVSDCIAIVVSEETSKISISMDGKISTNLSKQQLEKFLQKELI